MNITIWKRKKYYNILRVLMTTFIIRLVAILYVIVLPWVVRLYMEITHLSEWIILRAGGQTWYNYFIPPISV